MQSIKAAYDAVLATASIDVGSIRWLDKRTIGCTINGESYSAVVTVRTEQGLRQALAQCVADFCAVHAVATVVGGN